eukprot:scaffold25154_cov80-Skeletonema_marinoi.AAC.1
MAIGHLYGIVRFEIVVDVDPNYSNIHDTTISTFTTAGLDALDAVAVAVAVAGPGAATSAGLAYEAVPNENVGGVGRGVGALPVDSETCCLDWTG